MLTKTTQLLVLAGLLLMAAPTSAQPSRGGSPWYGALTYNMAVPFGSTSDFAGGFSPLGIGLDIRYKIRPNWSAGIGLAWQVIYGKTTDPVTIENVTVQGTQYRYSNIYPMLVNGHYYLPELSDRIVPFAGFGLGAYYMERRVDVGIYAISNGSWHFGIAPEVGIGFRVLGALPVLIVRYNHAFSSEGTGDQSFLNMNVGIAWN